MRIFFQTFLLIALVFPILAKSQLTIQPDSLLNKMTGNWVLRGTIGGQQTVHDIEARRVLNGQYVQLKEVSREKNEKGEPAYNAIVYICWQNTKKQYACLWLDNTSNEGISNHVIGLAGQDGYKIELLFKFSDAVQFHTTFAYDENADAWQWIMNGEENGTLQPFARVTLTRN